METNNNSLYIPESFWLNLNSGLAIPAIGLTYHEIKIKLELDMKWYEFRKYNNFYIDCIKENKNYDNFLCFFKTSTTSPNFYN